MITLVLVRLLYLIASRIFAANEHAVRFDRDHRYRY
jgi:hypothetical protein